MSAWVWKRDVLVFFSSSYRDVERQTGGYGAYFLNIDGYFLRHHDSTKDVERRVWAGLLRGGLELHHGNVARCGGLACVVKAVIVAVVQRARLGGDLGQLLLAALGTRQCGGCCRMASVAGELFSDRVYGLGQVIDWVSRGRDAHSPG